MRIDKRRGLRLQSSFEYQRLSLLRLSSKLKTWSSVNLLLVGLSCHKSSHQTIKTFCCSTLADAGENRGEQRTAAADAQNDPADHVVNVHEVTG